MPRFTCRFIIGIAFLLSAFGLTACGPRAPGTSGGQPVSIGGTAFAGTVVMITIEPAFGTSQPPDFTPPPSANPPTLTPIPTLPGGVSPTELKYRVLDQFPDLFFCDPDFYPVARADEGDLARQRFPELQANTEEFNTILAHMNLAGQTTFSDDQKLLIYDAHKKLAAIRFTATGKGYQFQIQVAKTKGNGELVSGLIDGQGKITVQQRKPSIASCPICLAAGTRIDTPSGPVPVQELRVGTLVWTANRAGMRVSAPVLRLSKIIVPANHQVVHLVLNDARELWVSPGHPTTDGRRFGMLRAGGVLDGAVILSVDRVPYAGFATYDLLPAGETGFYWANGILIASTLK